MKKYVDKIAFGILIAVALVVLNALHGNPVSKALAERGADKVIAAKYGDLDLSREKVFYNFKAPEYVVHLQDKNSEDSAFELCFDSFGRLQRDRYDLHIDNMVERFDRAIHDNGSGLEKAHDLPYQITLSFWGKIDPAEDLTMDQPKASIAGRPYQILAVKAVMERFEANYPAALLVMATGTGKTRTAASIVDMMMGANRATRILFLADRVALVKQAMRTFGQLLPDLSIASVGEAVKNGYLVDYRTWEVKLKFPEEGFTTIN